MSVQSVFMCKALSSSIRQLSCQAKNKELVIFKHTVFSGQNGHQLAFEGILGKLSLLFRYCRNPFIRPVAFH